MMNNFKRTRNHSRVDIGNGYTTKDIKPAGFTNGMIQINDAEVVAGGNVESDPGSKVQALFNNDTNTVITESTLPNSITISIGSDTIKQALSVIKTIPRWDELGPVVIMVNRIEAKLINAVERVKLSREDCSVIGTGLVSLSQLQSLGIKAKSKFNVLINFVRAGGFVTVPKQSVIEEIINTFPEEKEEIMNAMRDYPELLGNAKESSQETDASNTLNTLSDVTSITASGTMGESFDEVGNDIDNIFSPTELLTPLGTNKLLMNTLSSTYIGSWNLTTERHEEKIIDLTKVIDPSFNWLEQDWVMEATILDDTLFETFVSYKQFDGLPTDTRRNKLYFSYIELDQFETGVRVLMEDINSVGEFDISQKSTIDPIIFRGISSRKQYTLKEARGILSGLSSAWKATVGFLSRNKELVIAGVNLGAGALGKYVEKKTGLDAQLITNTVNWGLGVLLGSKFYKDPYYVRLVNDNRGLSYDMKALALDVCTNIVPSCLKVGKAEVADNLISVYDVKMKIAELYTYSRSTMATRMRITGAAKR